MTVLPTPRFTTISTALLIAIVALPVSAIAFAVLYANHDKFWAAVWLFAVLPGFWVAAGILVTRDAFKRRSWRQIASVIALLAATVVMVNATFSWRFWDHRLFSFTPLPDQRFASSSGAVFSERFPLCDDKSPCMPRTTVVHTRSFTLRKIPDGCCKVLVINGNGSGNHKVDVLRVALNGRPIDSPQGDSRLTRAVADVALSKENAISIEMRGGPDSYAWVLVAYSNSNQTAAQRR